ncbi:Hsp70 family protein [Akkermansiaceae bacterium]|nr:Hsp70 family protein [Akkermansiaceae bacterium]
MSNIIGIDLGTTFSVIAKLDDSGQPKVISVDGERTTPSCVLVESQYDYVVGSVAYNQLGNRPKSVVRKFKRHIGSEKIYPVSCGVELNPISASALVLKKLCQEASKSEGEIRDVVITVPASFAERQRKATMAAGAEAGLNVVNIINEPTAAILAYAIKQPVNGNVMVYDLGGGTFDVTVASVQGTDIQCLTSRGSAELGGIDFDYKLAEIIDQKYKEQYGRTLKEALQLSGPEDEQESEGWQTLMKEAEMHKKTLSKLKSTSVAFLGGPDGPLKCEVTREEFNRSIQGLVANTEMEIETVLNNLKMTPRDIDIVLLVGGSTRVPMVIDSVQRIMGKAGSQEINPDEAVAIGAAVYAGVKSAPERLKPMQRAALDGITITDCANHYYGTIVMDTTTHRPNVSIMLEKNSPLPCFNSKTFYTREDNLEWLRFRLTQSAEEETNPDFVNIVFDKEMGPLPAGNSANQPIEVTYRYDENQVMSIELRDINSGRVFKESYKTTHDVNSQISIPSFRIN